MITKLKWWMRIVGSFYLFLSFAAIVLRLPIRVEGPKGVLDQATAGNQLANFVVDTWITYGLDLLVIGAALLIASRKPERAKVLILTVIGLELVRGIGADLYKIIRGYELSAEIIWIVIHSVIVLTGLRFLGWRAGKTGRTDSMPR